MSRHNVLIPTGAGSNVLGCDIGFGELLRSGEIDLLAMWVHLGIKAAVAEALRHGEPERIRV